MPNTCPVCGGVESVYLISRKSLVQLNKTLNVDNVVADAINQLYNDRSVKTKTQDDLFKGFYEPLKQAVDEGFGKTLASIEYGTPNYEMLKNLQTNTAVFSIFKAHAFTKEVTALLKDEAGNLRPKEQFKAEALKLDNTYRVDYLDTEYDTAVRSARMATIWAKAQQTKHLYPNLKYLPSRAANPRADHQKYYGIVAPTDSLFWATHLPPNGFRCQCGAAPTDEDTTDIPHDLPPPEKGFGFNSGITGQVFDLKNSSYIKSVPPKEQPALIKQATAVVNNHAATTAPLQPLYTAKNGNEVVAHPLATKNTDFNELYQTARALANTNIAPKKIEILPTINDKDLRDKLLPKAGVKNNTNPDYLFDGKQVADLKTVNQNTKRAVQGAVSACHAQCDNLVLNIPDNNSITNVDLYRYVKGQLNDSSYSDFEDVYIFYRGVWYRASRKEIIEGKWPIPH